MGGLVGVCVRVCVHVCVCVRAYVDQVLKILLVKLHY